MSSSSLHGFTVELHGERWEVITTAGVTHDVPLDMLLDFESTVDVISCWLIAEIPELVQKALEELESEPATPFTADGECRFIAELRNA